MLKGLARRKLRTALTALAIVLGVAMISGTYVITDTIGAGFNSIFTNSYQGSDAVISGKSAFSSGNSGPASSPGFSAALLAKVRRLDGVAAAAGSVQDEAKLIDRHGKPIARGGAPSLAFGIDSAQSRFNPLSLVRGRWPAGPGQVAIDQGTATKEGFAVGDRITVAARGPARRFSITGIARFGSVASIGGATVAVFDVPTGQALFGKRGKLDQIRLAASPGVSTARLVAEIRPLLPATAQVETARAQAKADAGSTSTFLKIFKYVLLAFAGVALFVGSFVIANTLSITIAQRTRELATLRTLGASRRQVLRSVIVEALAIGALGSVAGLFAGLGLARGLDALFVAIGIDLPKSATVFAGRTVVVSLVLGTLVALLASLRPALRATRVPPIAAVREGFVLPPSRLARYGTASAVAVAVVGLGGLSFGALASGVATATRLAAVGTGAALLFVGVALFAPRLVSPLTRVLGWPAARIAGSAGELARHNARRDPARTASTAAALMIGLALVTVVAVLGQELRSSLRSAVDRLFVADYALTSQDGFTPLSAQATARLRRAPGVTVVSGVREGSGRAFGKTIGVTGVDLDLSRVLRIDWYRGSSAVPAQLGRGGAFVDRGYAKAHRLALGSPLRLETPSGRFLTLRVHGIFRPPNGGSPFGSVTVSTAAFDSVYPDPANLYSFVDVRGGATPANTAALRRALRAFPDAKVATRTRFKVDQQKPVDNLLNLLYVLLGLSVLVSLLGIVNTLALTVFERRRELGLLRAVGMTRRQVRRMVRHESVITALIGAALGIVVGLVLAALLTRALSGQGLAFAVPVVTLAVFVAVAVLVGVLAAIAPARRAARLDVLEALQYE